MQVRSATVNDAQGIVMLNISQNQFKGWFRNPFLREGACRYKDLTPFQRMLHGGYWMDINLCRRHLHEYITRGFPVFVAEEAGKIVGECELWLGEEVAPFGKYAEIEMLISSEDADRVEVEHALLDKSSNRCAKLGLRSLDASPKQTCGTIDFRKLGFKEIWDTRECSIELVKIEEPDFDFTIEPIQLDDAIASQLISWDHREPSRLRLEVMAGDWPPMKLAYTERHEKRVVARIKVGSKKLEFLFIGWSPEWMPRPTTWVSIWSPASVIRKKSQVHTVIKATVTAVERLGKNVLTIFVPKQMLPAMRELGFEGGEESNPWLRKSISVKTR